MASETGISGFFSRLWQKIVDHFEDYEVKREKVLHNLSFLSILVIGVIVRLFPLLRGYDILIKAFDPYMQMKSTEYIAKYGLTSFVHWFKTDSWYPFGFHPGQELYWGIPLSGYIVYWFLNLLSINISVQTAAFFSPVIYGTLALIAAYYLGKEAISPRAGLFTAFFMAISPAYLSRSVAGFYDNEYLGILFLLLTLLFFIRSMKTGSNASAFLSGISLAGLMGSWGAYRFILDLLPLAVIVLVLARKLNYSLIKAYTITISTAISIGFLVPRVLSNNFTNVDIMIPVLTVGLLVLVSIIQNLSRSLGDRVFKQVIVLSGILLVGILAAIIVALVSFGLFSNIAEKFWAVIVPSGRLNIPIISSVSEHQPMTWSQIFSNIHIMTFLIPLGFYYAIRKPTDVNIFIIVYGVTSIYFSGSMVRLALILGPAASLLSALAIDKLLYPYSLTAHGKIALAKRKIRIAKTIGRDEAILAYVVIFGLLVGFSIHSLSVAKQLANIEMQPVISSKTLVPSSDWQDALSWLREHAISDGIVPNSPTVVLSWWDYGYWITNYGNATTLVDNATTNKTQIGVVGTMLMSNFSVAVRLMYKYNVKYVLINSQAGLSGLGSDLGKAIWCIRIAESTVPQYGIKESDFTTKNSKGYTIYSDKFYDSVLYRLAAYDPSSGFAFPQDPQGQLGSPIGDNAGMLEKAQKHPVKDLSGSDGFVYFKEVFRSYGLASSIADAYKYPFIKIYEVIYPPNIAQLSAELNQFFGNS